MIIVHMIMYDIVDMMIYDIDEEVVLKISWIIGHE